MGSGERERAGEKLLGGSGRDDCNVYEGMLCF